LLSVLVRGKTSPRQIEQREVGNRSDFGRWPTDVWDVRSQMTVTKEKKQELIGSFRRADNDTGSPEVQIALLTSRIGQLTDHLRTHKKDYASRRGLLMMVSRRRRLLDYLKRVTPQRYLDVIRRLDIRK
jgi:small subunit ribosomal protein S15